MLLCNIIVSAHDFEVDGIYYNITSETDLTVEVTCKGNYAFSYVDEYTGEVVIPKSIFYNNNIYSVTNIDVSAFRYCVSLISIIIPNSVISIGNSAFSGCTGMTSIAIPESVTSIGHEAFKDCIRLNAVHITDISAWCYINYLGFDANPLFYAHHLYLNGEKIQDLVIPDSVKSIGNGTFKGCTSLTSVTIPNSVRHIEEGAFSGCTSLKSIVVNEGNKYYDSRENCNAIIDTENNLLIVGCKNSTIPNSVTNISEDAFNGCIGLTNITIPYSMKSIDNYAFNGCTSLQSIIIPNSVTKIGMYAFYGCI